MFGDFRDRVDIAGGLFVATASRKASSARSDILARFITSFARRSEEATSVSAPMEPLREFIVHWDNGESRSCSFLMSGDEETTWPSNPWLLWFEAL